jgi:chemosensory pili system protein ChpA (sensor histidine kinase/response regulator)
VRELQRDLLRTRMMEFDGLAERLHGVVRQAAKDAGRQARLEIVGGSIEIDRGVLERMTPVFEHIVRNAVAHGLEPEAQRKSAGKYDVGVITVSVSQEGNDVAVTLADDGAGLDLERIRAKAQALGLIDSTLPFGEAQAAEMIFRPGFSTATQVTEWAGRGVGLDVVQSEVQVLGGRVEVTSEAGQGTRFKLVLPLTTAVTQVVQLRLGAWTVGVPATLVEIVRRLNLTELQQAYAQGQIDYDGVQVPFFWSGALLNVSARSRELQDKTLPVVILRSAGQRVALHVDDVLGHQEAVIKNLGPQLARLPGLTGMSVTASGAVVLIYNPVALATVLGDKARALAASGVDPQMTTPLIIRTPEGGAAGAGALPGAMPLVLVVDDSITVRRVTQRFLRREGYRVALAADGLQAMEQVAQECPALILSDIEMPRMNGFDLVRALRADARYKDLPVVMITSRMATKHRELAEQLGVNHYLGKPYSEDELLNLVRHYCPVEEAEVALTTA